ncbi:MAG: aminotransferase class IV [Phycisphaerales bacterium]|jgi:branched-subunit amino acid aminotransferase/4-amino-4-deoxychorismate lyase
MSTVFLNGSFLTPDQAMVGAFDAGLQHGVGLFETLLAVRDGDGSRVVHLDQHLQRLADSARELNLSEHLRTPALADAVRRTVDRAFADQADAQRLRVRLTITGGDLNLLSAAKAGGEAREHAPTLLIHAQPAAAYPPEMLRRGVLATIADWKANPLDPFQGHKTLNYWPRLRELQIAAGKRAAEALVMQVTNYLAGGCVSNAFIVADGELVTPIARGEEEDVLGEEGLEPQPPAEGEPVNNYDPPIRGVAVPSPVLPGVVRRWVMDWALAEGIECSRRLISIRDVLDADEVFLTNSSWGVLPVVSVESHAVGEGKVGPIATRLVDAWSQIAAVK